VYNIPVFKTANRQNLPDDFDHFLTELDPEQIDLKIALETLQHAKPDAQSFYFEKKPTQEMKTIQKRKRELKHELKVLREKEKILMENLRILEKKATIKAKEAPVKAKRKAIDQLEFEIQTLT
jgi:hypothetical protein